MNRQGVSFFPGNNAIERAERYCEPCMKRGRISFLGRMTREEYVRAHYPKDPRYPRLGRHEYPCPKCFGSAMIVPKGWPA